MLFVGQLDFHGRTKNIWFIYLFIYLLEYTAFIHVAVR